jgi:hypothetical protein
MPFTEGALREALLTETQGENNGQLICLDFLLDPNHNLPVTPVFWSTGSIGAAVLNCSPKQITPIMCISAHEGNQFGVTIETTPRAVIINHDDTLAHNAIFSKNAISIAN